MSYKKLGQKFTPEELAGAIVFPVKLSPKQQREAEKQLAGAREKSLGKMTEGERLTGSLMELKFRMKDYFKSDELNSEYSFAGFLKLYIELLGRKRREFAAEIGIDEALLSQFINQHRTPPDYIPVRLELHSNNLVPAEYWLRAMGKDRERKILSNMAVMMKREQNFVTGGISVRLASEQVPDFEKAELESLKENLRRSYKERFLMTTTLYKLQQTMKKAVISHKPFISK